MTPGIKEISKQGNKAEGDAEGDTVRYVIGSRPTSAEINIPNLAPHGSLHMEDGLWPMSSGGR